MFFMNELRTLLQWIENSWFADAENAFLDARYSVRNRDSGERGRGQFELVRANT
jgi:hypothetical protein